MGHSGATDGAPRLDLVLLVTHRSGGKFYVPATVPSGKLSLGPPGNCSERADFIESREAGEDRCVCARQGNKLQTERSATLILATGINRWSGAYLAAALTEPWG